MSTLRQNLLALAERIRGSVPGALDLRPYTVTVIVRTWTGARPGIGTKTDTPIVITNYGYNPKIEQVKSKDIVASGGLYQEGDLRIGPITPEHPLGGVLYRAVDPATVSTAQEVYFKVDGPAMPSGGAYYKRVQDDTYKNLRMSVVVRRTAFTP